MADFTADLLTNFSIAPWTDPATLSAASRLNDNPSHPRLYKRVTRPVGAAVATLVLEATVGGVVGPADAALGGRLFVVSWAQWSGGYPPVLSQPVGGFSSIVHATITSAHLGYFAVLFWRPAGGSVAVPFSVE